MRPLGARSNTRSWAAAGAAGGLSVRVLALVILAAQAATLGHQLLERHQICREHGELIHSGQAHAHAGSPASRADLDSLGGPSSVRRAAELGAEEHEHCGLACSSSKVLINAPHAMLLPALAVVRSPSAPAATAVFDFRELHRLAPKQSPPA